MILLDKSIAQSRLILTLTENSNEVLFDLVLHSFYTNKTYTIELGEDHSDHPERFNEFTIESALYKEMEEGRYTYKVVERATEKVIEHGVLTVKGTPSAEYLSIAQYESDDDFIVLD